MITQPTHEEVGSLVPIQQGKDYGQEARDQVRKLSIKDDLHEFFLKLFDKKKQDDKEWRDAKKQMVRARSYFDGRQFGTVTDAGRWVDYDLRPGEQTYMDNVYHAHVQTALTELTRANTKLSFSHISPNSRIGQLVAKIAEARYEVHKKRTFTSLKVDKENLSLLLNGMALRYTYWNHNGRKEKIPTFGAKQVEGGEGVSVCKYCSSTLTNGQCPNCGSNDATQIPSQGYEAKTITGYQDIDCGESDWESVDPLGVTFYIRAGCLKETPYMIWEQSILEEVLQAQFPDVKIETGSESEEMRDKDDMDAMVANSRFLANSASSRQDIAEFVQGWFQAPLYAHRTLTETIKLRNGMVLEKGRKLGDYFPNGLYLAKNCKTILDVWGENLCDKWTCAPYVTRIGTMVGAGTTIALANQDIKNDLRNLHMRSIFNDAFNKEFVNANYLEGQTVPSDPSERAMVTNLPDGQRIVGTVIDRLPGAPLSTDAYALEERVDASIQIQLGTFSGGTADAMPDAAKNTATGYLTWRNTAIGRYSPMLATKADALDREQAYQLLENDQKYTTPQQWEKLKGDYGVEAVKAFMSCKLRDELIVEVLPESFVPRTLQDRRSEKMAFMELMHTLQIDPNSDWGGFLGADYDIPKSLVGFESYESMAYEHIYAFKEIADNIIAQFGDIPSYDVDTDPIAMQIGQLIVENANKPVDAKMEDITVIVETYKDWWATDAGRQSSNALKAAIKYQIAVIDGSAIAEAQHDQEMAMAAQEPMMEAQAEQMQAQGQQQAEAEGAASEAEAQAREEETGKEAVRVAIDDEKEVRKMEYDAEQKALDRAHQLELASMAQRDKPDAKKKK